MTGSQLSLLRCCLLAKRFALVCFFVGLRSQVSGAVRTYDCGVLACFGSRSSRQAFVQSPTFLALKLFSALSLYLLVQEAHGRLGKEAAEILSYIATEASQRSGGNKYEIAAKRSRILVTLKSGLSTSLAVQMAQRIFGHVRGSAVHGQQPHPISALLSLSKE